MQRKLPRFFLLSFLSFCFFTVMFHVGAYAQGFSNQTTLSSPLKVQQIQIQPTPTIFIAKPNFTVQNLHAAPVNPSPTPTVFINVRPTSTITPLPTAAITSQPVNETTTIPVLSPTTMPSPTVAISPTGTPLPTTQGPVDMDLLFSQYSTQYGVSVDELKKIAQCESGFNTNSNTGVYAGMYQFLSTTWESVRDRMGLDPDPTLRMNPGDAIQTAAFMLSQGEENAWPNCH